jgi:tRNA (cmo5U34)-methyltransferase
MQKSTVEQIRERFDNSVERFSHLETGNLTQVDSPLSLELIAQAAAATTPNAKSILDIGCGAGNYALKLLQYLPNREITLLDLSSPMLNRAQQRVSAATTGRVTTVQGDIRERELGEGQFDVIVGAAVFHHLREESEWRHVFTKLHTALRPGGTFWIYDLILHSMPELEAGMKARYSEYLTNMKDAAYRDMVFGWIDMEDTPRPLMFQINVLTAVGFREVDILHKNSCFAAFGARK